ncbi:ABC transporter [Vairimorpha necatrix]|uniref:ABC transporter n=1 Tax=Vairimorpha necatrix TaxID=6039 RepID=A0AAX4JFV7_9MICR
MQRETKTLQFENLYYDVPNVDPNIHGQYAEILKSLSGKIESGKLTAVLGSSGCGKTHLLRMLVGNISEKSKTYGRILYNGEERDPEEWKLKFSYVPQDDVFYPDLSIYDHMKYYMSLGEAKYCEFDERKADKILDGCAILHKKNCLVGALSGGERKRALIAISMINDPEILILDEPTTGLDSNTALKIIYTLKKYAQDHNCMVISTIHQPGASLFSYFDDLIVLVKLGVFYIGPYKQLESFLVENGISTESELSLPELLLVIISDRSKFPEAKKNKSNVENIVEKNNATCRNENTAVICNNYKTLVFKPKLYDSWKIMKYAVTTKSKYKQRSISTGSAAILGIIALFFGAIGLYNKSSSSEHLDFYDELKQCSYGEILSFSFGVVNHLYHDIVSIWYLFPQTGTCKDEQCFLLEYLNGKYTYGTYFMAILYHCLIRNFLFFFIKFCICLLIFRNILFHPIVFLVFSISTAIYIFLSTFISIFIGYNAKLFFTCLFIQSLADVIIGKDLLELEYDGFIYYLISSIPIINYRLFLRMRCFGLAEKFRNKTAICEFLNETCVKEIIKNSYEEGAANTIIYNTFGKWADFITVFCMFGSCLFLIIVLTLLYKIYRIPNMRFKLSK